MGKSVKAQLAQRLEGLTEITLATFEEIQKETGASPDYLRRLLRRTAISLHPLIEGVRQDSVENLTRTLDNLAQLYATQPKEARGAVLESKRHAQLALRRNPMDDWRNTVLLHLNTWLENPTIYPLWARLKK